jgi:hypothetical protein
MSQRLPIELWESILRYSISVPIFFDVDPTATNSLEEFMAYYRDEQPYWASERRRNKLRRVCSAWDIYLQQFDHRFVRLHDIIRGELSWSVIRKARRVKSYVPPQVFNMDPSLERILGYYIDQEEGEWAVTILDGGTAQFDNALLMSRKTPHLKSIPNIQPFSLTLASHLLPSLRLVLLTGEQTGEGISLPSLTTLRMYQTTNNASYAWKFGSLQHLSFQGFELKSETFIEMLRSIGQNLITCFDASYPSDQEFPDETWSLCPRLRQIQTSFTWPADASIPSSIQCIRIPIEDLSFASEAPSLSRLPALAILEARIQKVRCTWRWWEIIDDEVSTLDYLLFGMEYGIFLQDEEGTDFRKFLVTLLSFYWKRNIRRRPRMLTRVVTVLF